MFKFNKVYGQTATQGCAHYWKTCSSYIPYIVMSLQSSIINIWVSNLENTIKYILLAYSGQLEHKDVLLGLVIMKTNISEFSNFFRVGDVSIFG